MYRKIKSYVVHTVTTIVLLSLSCNTSAQEVMDHDSAYYETYPDLLVGRTYYSRKFTGINIDFPDLTGQILKYRPNTTHNLGIGASYKWATLNLAYGFSFLNPDRGEGKTKYLDLQSHQYTRKFNIDLYGQFYKGSFLKNIKTPENQYYVRPDVRVQEVGMSAEYILNYRELSFRAAFMNTEYQKKTAGSFLVGFRGFYGKISADSTLVPDFLGVYDQADYDQLKFFKIGPSAGYAVNIVLGKHFYTFIATSVGLNVGTYSLRSDDNTDSNSFFSASLVFRGAVGYNSRLFNIGVFYLVDREAITSDYRNLLLTGNIRFIFAWRINAPDKLADSSFFSRD